MKGQTQALTMSDPLQGEDKRHADDKVHLWRGRCGPILSLGKSHAKQLAGCWRRCSTLLVQRSRRPAPPQQHPPATKPAASHPSTRRRQIRRPRDGRGALGRIAESARRTVLRELPQRARESRRLVLAGFDAAKIYRAARCRRENDPQAADRHDAAADARRPDAATIAPVRRRARNADGRRGRR